MNLNQSLTHRHFGSVYKINWNSENCMSSFKWRSAVPVSLSVCVCRHFNWFIWNMPLIWSNWETEWETDEEKKKKGVCWVYATHACCTTSTSTSWGYWIRSASDAFWCQNLGIELCNFKFIFAAFLLPLKAIWILISSIKLRISNIVLSHLACRLARGVKIWIIESI